MLNNKGFSLIETIASFSILMMIMLTLIPIVYQLKAEEAALSIRRDIPSVLHDELQKYLWENNFSLPIEKNKTLDGTLITFRYKMEGELLEGCASWNNAKQKNETFCLYGYNQ